VWSSLLNYLSTIVGRVVGVPRPMHVKGFFCRLQKIVAATE
jgi:hypothetical protein